MNRARHLLGLVLALLILLAGAAPLSAATLTQFVGMPGGPVDLLTLSPFDPALGTLDSIRVRIDGTVAVKVHTDVAFCAPFCGPYPYQVVVQQSFSGIGTKYFDSTAPAHFQFDTFSPPSGGDFDLAGSYHYDFTFNAASDLLGFAPVSLGGGGLLTAIPPIGGMTGKRDDFKRQPPLGVDLMFVTTVPDSATASGLAPDPLFAGLPTAPALMEIDYLYTPAAVPGPTPLFALVVGLAALRCRGLFRRRG